MSTITTAPPIVLAGPPGQPDIAYTPDLANHLQRQQRRIAQLGSDAKTLPPGFPDQLESPLVWNGESLPGTYDWTYNLSKTDLDEIKAAVHHFQSLGKPLGYVSQDTFPLPNLHPVLRSISHEIHNGHGFKVVSGVPVDEYSREENMIIYAGLASHVAPVRGRQERHFHGKPADVAVAHIIDLSSQIDARQIGAPAFTTEKQVFHTDAGDIIALFALGTAAEGGQSYLSSSWAVYNELARTRPDLVKTLAEPWKFDDNDGNDGKGYKERPLLYHQASTTKPDGSIVPERTIIQYARRFFTGYWGLPRTATIPPITEAQAEALDALHFTAEKLALGLDFQKGDIQFVNNLSIFHARAGFRDSDTQRRHLLRLWLRDPEYAWETPAPLSGLWDRVYGDLQAEREVFPLDPSLRPTNKAFNGAKTIT